MTSAKGSFDFLRTEFCVGTALIVDRIYFEGQLAVGEAVTAVFESVSLNFNDRYEPRTYVWGDVDRRWGKVQLGDIEGLVRQICRVQLGQGSTVHVRCSRSLLTWKLWLLLVCLRLSSRLATHLHVSHALCDTSDTRRATSRCSCCWVALIRSWVASVSRLSHRLLLLGIELAVLRISLSGGWQLLLLLLLLIGLRVAAVCR